MEEKIKIEREVKLFITSILLFIVGIVSFFICLFPPRRQDSNNQQVELGDGQQNSDSDSSNEPVIYNEKVEVANYIKDLNKRLNSNKINLQDGYILLDELISIDETFYADMQYEDNLRTGWIKVENDIIDEYTFYYDNCLVSRIKYVEYVDSSTNVTQSSYASSNDVIKTYKYEEEYRLVGEKGLDYTISQNYNTLEYILEKDAYEYTGKMKYYNVQDYVTYGEAGDYGICTKADCSGCVDCIIDWTRCIKKVTDMAMITGGVIIFPTNEYLVDLDDDSGLEYEILPDGSKSSFDASRTRNNRGRGIFLNGNYITYKENVVDVPLGYAPIIFDLCGSKIKLEKNHMANYSVIEARNCKYVEIKNGTIQGDRMEHDYTEFLYDGVNITTQSGDAGNHTQGYGIKIRSTEMGIVSNMNVYDLTADALCFNKATYWTTSDPLGCLGNDTNVEVKYTYAHHSRRQAITVGDITSINIHHTEMAYIGGGNTLNSDGSYSLEIGWAYEEDRLKYEGLLTDEDKNIVGTLGVGKSPMAGIDFEPDRGTFQVKKGIVDNCYIHTTDGYSIVGVGCSTSHHTTPDLIISNSYIDGFICLSEDQDEYYDGVFYSAENIQLKNNIIIFSDPVVQRGYTLDENLQVEIQTWVTLETKYLNFSDCIIRKTYKGSLTYYNITNTYINCIIEQDENTLIYLENPSSNVSSPNGYLRLAENCNFINCTFRNLIGAQVNSSYWYSYGLIIMEGGIAENYGNIFDNCSVMSRSCTLGNPSKNDIIDITKISYFKGGNINVYNGDNIINNFVFIECLTNATCRYLELNYCIVLNTETIFGDKNGDSRADRYINNCYFHFNNESMFSSRLNRSSHWGGLWKNSVLRIEEDVSVANVKCTYTDESVASPHFTFMSMTDLDDIELTQISLNKDMESKSNLLFRNNNYVEEDNLHTGSDDYKGLCFYDSDEWLNYVEEQSKTNQNKIYALAYEILKLNDFYK